MPRDLVRAIEHAARNIRRVAEEQRPRSWTMTVEPGVRVGQRVTPLGTIGCYIPGGRFSLFSTLLMTAIPAQVAGVKRIVVACPKPSPALLAAAEILGITEIARMGGAQAIGAIAYGTQSIPRVDKICGPGNRFVTAAKRIVSNDCAIDMPAGPTEVLILATGGSAALHRRGYSCPGGARSRRCCVAGHSISSPGERGCRRSREATEGFARNESSLEVVASRKCDFGRPVAGCGDPICEPRGAGTFEHPRREQEINREIVRSGKCISWPMERAADRRLRQRHESCSADFRLGSRPGRFECHGLRKMFEHAGNFARRTEAPCSGRHRHGAS